MKQFRIISSVLALALAVVSCNRTTGVDVVEPNGVYNGGVLVSNEGNYGRPNADISYIDYTLSKIDNNIYNGVNEENLGDVFQNVGFKGDNAYFVMNNSNKVVVADRYTFKKKAEITQEIKQPRYITFVDNHAYVTNSTGGYVSVYNTTNNSFVKKIDINKTTERIVTAGENVFVQNASYGSGNELTVISSRTNEVTSTIQVPNGSIDRTIAYRNNVYVIAGDDTKSYIYQYDANGELLKTINLNGLANAKNLDIYNDTFYFTSGISAYAMPFNATAVPQTPLFNIEDKGIYFNFYGFNVLGGFIFVSDPNGFTENSKVSIYTLNGRLVRSFTAGMGTNGFYMN